MALQVLVPRCDFTPLGWVQVLNLPTSTSLSHLALQLSVAVQHSLHVKTFTKMGKCETCCRCVESWQPDDPVGMVLVWPELHCGQPAL